MIWPVESLRHLSREPLARRKEKCGAARTQANRGSFRLVFQIFSAVTNLVHPPLTVYRSRFFYPSIAPANKATSPNDPEIEATIR